MSSSNLVPQYLRGHWEVVAEGASNAGITPDRSQWHINREVFVAETNDLARERPGSSSDATTWSTNGPIAWGPG